MDTDRGVRVEHEPKALVEMRPVAADEERMMGWLFPAVAECVEEAILNSLCRAHTVTGRDGHVRHALPVDKVAALVRRYVDMRRETWRHDEA